MVDVSQNTISGGGRPPATDPDQEPVAVLSGLGRRLDELLTRALRDRGAQVWAVDTAAPGWAVATQIAHLAWTDEVSLCALRDPESFVTRYLDEAVQDPLGYVDAQAHRMSRLPGPQLCQQWRDGREAMVRALEQADPAVPIPWFGPPMRPKSMATARLMETWAHGTDVADALGDRLEATDALAHIARLGVRTRDFAYLMNDPPAPAEEFRVELTDAGGGVVSFGPVAATERVTGPIEDFCLLVTQRIHRADTALRAEGPQADHWLDIAQAFAGLPGAGRAPGSRS